MSTDGGKDKPVGGPRVPERAASQARGKRRMSTGEMRAPTWELDQWEQQEDTRPEMEILEFQEDLPTSEMAIDSLPSEAISLAFTRLARMARQLVEDIDRTAPSPEAPKERVRRRISSLLVHAQQLDQEGDSERAALALELAFAESPDSVLAHKLLSLHEHTIAQVFENYLGDLDAVPKVAVNTDQLLYERIDAHAAFLLSRVDGMLSLNELFDIAGMSRIHALRYSAALKLRGILIVSPR